MIKVLEEKPAPRAQVRCEMCGSLLEYGADDLIIEERVLSVCTMIDVHIQCPVCKYCTPAKSFATKGGAS